jgi:hypothetical protein
MACLSVDKERKGEKYLIISILRETQMYIENRGASFKMRHDIMS